MGIPLDRIERFLGEYAEALSSADTERIVEMWELPSMVLSDQGALVVDRAEQVTQFFSAAPEQYRAVGIVATAAEHLAVEQLSDRICSADVRWVGLDAHGRPTEHRELSTYLLRLGDDDAIRIQVALQRPSRIPEG